MMNRFLNWLRYEFVLYMKIVFTLATTNISVETIGKMMHTDVNISWQERVELRRALKEKDFATLRKLLNTVKMGTKLDKQQYDKFLRKVMIYQIFTFILVMLAIAITTVLIFGRR